LYTSTCSFADSMTSGDEIWWVLGTSDSACVRRFLAKVIRRVFSPYLVGSVFVWDRRVREVAVSRSRVRHDSLLRSLSHDTWGKVDMGPTRQVEKPWAYRSCRKVHGREQKGHSHWVTDSWPVGAIPPVLQPWTTGQGTYRRCRRHR